MLTDDATPLLEARDLTAILEVDGAVVRVLDGVSLALAPGEVVDVVGPSGSGKSTLLRALARLMPGASSDVRLRGRSAAELSPQHWRGRVSLLPQKAAIVPGTVRDNLLLPWRFKVREDSERPGDGDLRHALEVLGLGEVALDREAEKLSVGQQARLAFARLWLASPDVLLLDEADAALDDESAADMRAAVAHFATEGGRLSAGEPGAVVRVRHRADDGLAARRLRLENGRLTEVAR